MKIIMSLFLSFSLLCATVVPADQVSDETKKLKNVETEISDLQDQLDKTDSQRTTGVIIGISVSTVAFLASAATFVGEAGGTFLVNLGSGAINALGQGEKIGTVTPTYGASKILIATSTVAAGGTVIWYFVKNSQMKSLRNRLELAKKTAKDIEDALAEGSPKVAQ